MSEIKVNKVTPRVACGTTQLGDSGDTFNLPSGVTMTVASGATITNSGTASGFGATGEISWDTTVKTTGTFTATAGIGYFLNTTGGIITVNLPAGTAGDSVAMVDYAGTWQTNNVTINANGSEKIGGVVAPATLETEGQSVTFVYIDGTQGWVNVLDSTSAVTGRSFLTATVSGACNTLATAPDCANTKIATFLGPGTFCVSTASSEATENIVSYMIVAGGAAGGNVGGGGAGGYREIKSPLTPYTASPLDGYGTPANHAPVTASPYPITVGGGGSAPPNGAAGTVSVFSTITSAGGGGGPGTCTDSCRSGDPGGSGGGAHNTCGGGGTGGTGNTPPVSPPQGNNGGNAPGASPGTQYYGAGGGGSSAVGAGGGAVTTGGNGGDGVASSITAASVTRSGGGGGGSYNYNAPTSPGTGGSGGGGNGGGGVPPGTNNATSGLDNTGGGGGGAGLGACGHGMLSGSGGSGVVIIRYKFQ